MPKKANLPTVKTQIKLKEAVQHMREKTFEVRKIWIQILALLFVSVFFD